MGVPKLFSRLCDCNNKDGLLESFFETNPVVKGKAVVVEKRTDSAVTYVETVVLEKQLADIDPFLVWE